MVRKISKTRSHSLQRVKRLFPKVETVSDWTGARITVTVTETDAQKASPGVESRCALAKAACRSLKLDGAIIGLSYSYLIKGTHATRYNTPATVAREMVSFDRNRDFDKGAYHLARISKSNRLGVKRQQKSGPRNTTLKPGPHIVHQTARVRQK
jgi:hypothetical protein